MTKERIAVVGAGPVGALAAIYLARLGYRATLVESGPSILCGAARVAAVAHFAGIEYPLDTPRYQTGKDCVFGGVLMKLCLPDMIYTKVVSSLTPARFFLSSGATATLPVARFYEHTEAMQLYYRSLYDRVRCGHRSVPGGTENDLHGPPERFIRRLSGSEWRDVGDIVAGISAVAAGLDMPAISVLLNHHLAVANVEVQHHREVDELRRFAGGGWEVRSSGRPVVLADQVVLAAGYHNDRLAATVGESGCVTYHAYLNLGTYVRLPEHAPAGLVFTLIDRHGGMCCPLEVKAGRSRLAMLYWPDPAGSQYDTAEVNWNDGKHVPEQWNHFIRYGVPDAEERARVIIRSLSHLYPWLLDAVVEQVVARPVVNPFGPSRGIRRDAQVTAFGPGLHGIVATKFTNSVTAAIRVVHAVIANTPGNARQNQSMFPNGLSEIEELPIESMPGQFILTEPYI